MVTCFLVVLDGTGKILSKMSHAKSTQLFITVMQCAVSSKQLELMGCVKIHIRFKFYMINHSIKT